MPPINPNTQRYNFPKKERLCGKRAFDYLFKHPTSFRRGVLKFFFVEDMPKIWVDAPISFGIAVAKRNFKKAHDRNRVKRLMRESIRLHKALLPPPLADSPHALVVFVKYESQKLPVFSDVEKYVIEGFQKIAHLLESKSPPSSKE